MSNKILYFFFFTFSFIKINAQTNYEFLGALKLNGDSKTVITYRLFFSENNGKIQGYSVTDLGGQHETKNTVTGTYNAKNKSLKFKEEDVLYTKSPLKSDVFCYVNYTGAVKLNGDKSKIEGEFKGLFKNKTKCIDGSLLLIGSTKIYKVVNKVNSKIQKSKKVDQLTKEKFNPITILDSLKVNNLIKDQNLNVFVKSEKVQIQIWDSELEDGDKINLFLNGKLILEGYAILNKKYIFDLNLDKEENVFKIEALNIGEKGQNTAKIQIIDDNRNYELSTSLKKDEVAFITLLKTSKDR